MLHFFVKIYTNAENDVKQIIFFVKCFGVRFIDFINIVISKLTNFMLIKVLLT